MTTITVNVAQERANLADLLMTIPADEARAILHEAAGTQNVSELSFFQVAKVYTAVKCELAVASSWKKAKEGGYGLGIKVGDEPIGRMVEARSLTLKVDAVERGLEVKYIDADGDIAWR